jgi:hypothetical protein
MSKFQAGDLVEQVYHGYGTNLADRGKQAIVIETNLDYSRTYRDDDSNIRGDGIRIQCIGEWKCQQDIRGEGGFKLVKACMSPPSSNELYSLINKVRQCL